MSRVQDLIKASGFRQQLYTLDRKCSIPKAAQELGALSAATVLMHSSQTVQMVWIEVVGIANKYRCKLQLQVSKISAWKPPQPLLQIEIHSVFLTPATVPSHERTCQGSQWFMQLKNLWIEQSAQMYHHCQCASISLEPLIVQTPRNNQKRTRTRTWPRNQTSGCLDDVEDREVAESVVNKIVKSSLRQS